MVDVDRRVIHTSMGLRDVQHEFAAIAPWIRNVRCPSLFVEDSNVNTLSLCTQVEILECDFTRLTDAGASRLRLPSIGILWFSAPHVTDDGMTWLSDCDELSLVRLDGTAITTRTVELLNEDCVYTLGLNGTSVQDDVIPCIGRMKDLRLLYLEETALTDAAADLWKDAACSATLVKVDLSDTDVGDDTAEVLATFDQLKEVDVRNTAVTEHGVRVMTEAGISVRSGVME